MFELTEVPAEFNQSSILLDRHLDEGRGNKTAVIYNGEHITYKEVLEKSNRAGNALLNLGVERENRVFICLPDSPQLLYIYFGAMRIGAVPIVVSTMATPHDYQYYLNDSRAKVLVTTEDLLSLMEPVKDDFKFLRDTILVDGNKSGTWNYDELLEKASPSLTPALTSKDDMAFWLYSSGTTGTPKGVVHLHHDLPHYITPYYKEVVVPKEDDIVFSISKMFFSYGRNNSIELPFFSGITVILEPALPKPEKLVEVITRDRPTILFSVPASYTALLNYLDNNDVDYDFSSLRMCVSAGEALPKSLFDQWKGKFGLEIIDGLGSTDVGAIYLSNLPGNVRPGSTGKLLTGFEGKLLDDNENEVPTGEPGTLWINNDGTTPFYWNKHDKSKAVICGHWFNTGDRFYKDEDGYFWYVGRADEMLKASGIWVSPLEIEGILLEHAAVMECAVIGAPDKDKLEKPMAFVVLSESYKMSAGLEKELQEYVQSKTAHYKYPRWVRFVEELPRTASGKLQRFKLKNYKAE